MNRSFEAQSTTARARFGFDIGLAVLLLSQAPRIQAAVPSMPMPIPFEDTIRHRWLGKPVAGSRLLDDMEDLAGWTHQGFGQMSLTTERFKDGTKCLRLTSPTKADEPGPTLGRPFGAAVARRSFDREDWSDSNRLSFWVYPTLPGFRVISMCVVLYNDGQEKVPGPYGRNGRNFVLLEPDRWNHVVWEIAHLGRDKVTGVEFGYRLQGNEPGATTTVTYDIDRLELQKVEPDHFEGWDVADGRIAYCHTGYPPNGSKTAIATNIQALVFSLLEASSGKTLLTKPIRETTSRVGTFQILDFSDFTEPGRYVIKAAGTTTRPFEIRKDIWRDTVWKTVNFFYCERCGTKIAGIHDTCHRDGRVKHADREILINGGWHDAGDLSQGLVNTSEATYAMLALADRLKDREPALAARLMEEARWGLDWILQTRFGDGHRCTWATMDFWTDGILGTVDDVTFEARNRPFENFLAASTEALAARMIQAGDPVMAAHCIKAARDDWQFARDETDRPTLELAAAGLQSSLDLYEAAGEPMYADEAFEFAETVLECQQQSASDWDVPLVGFFYRDPGQKRILHYVHRGHEQAPIVGLARLCRFFDNHSDWMDWYAAVALWSEYYRRVAEYTAPYYMLPASIYRVAESSRATFRQQVEKGIRLSEEHYLRMFPVWYDFRGNHGTVLSQTKGLSAAALLRNDGDLWELCRKQLQWVLGRNPFCQSTMYGEGHDYAPQYTAMSGDMVGSLPVGIQTHFERDAPYWPADNCYNFKEVWVHPSSRWLWLMCDLYETDVEGDGDFALSQQTSPAGDVMVKLTTAKLREEPFEIRAWNLKERPLQARAEEFAEELRTVTWRTTVIDANKPWVAVVLPNGDVDRSKDMVGNFPPGQ